MKQKIKTVPDLSFTSNLHNEAMVKGKDHFKNQGFNVIDEFKDLSIEDIKFKLKQTSNPFAVCFENWIGDFNLGTGVRNANAFNAEEVYYIGNKKLDRRSMVGVHNYTELKWLSSIDELTALQTKYTIIGVDNVPGSVAMENFLYPDKPLFVFGEEGCGLTPAMQALCKNIIHISMFGSVRSLNCGTASGIIMHDYIVQYKNKSLIQKELAVNL